MRNIEKSENERQKTWKLEYQKKMGQLTLIDFLIFVAIPFCWSWSGGWYIIWKSGGNWFWNKGFRRLLHTFIRNWRKFHADPVCSLLFFFGDKKKVLKALSTCTFIPSLLNSFNVSSGSSALSKSCSAWGKITYLEGQVRYFLHRKIVKSGVQK